MLFSKLNCIVRYDEPLKNHTTFKIGGNCIALIEPREVSDIVEIYLFRMKAIMEL